MCSVWGGENFFVLFICWLVCVRRENVCLFCFLVGCVSLLLEKEDTENIIVFLGVLCCLRRQRERCYCWRVDQSLWRRSCNEKVCLFVVLLWRTFLFVVETCFCYLCVRSCTLCDQRLLRLRQWIFFFIFLLVGCVCVYVCVCMCVTGENVCLFCSLVWLLRVTWPKLVFLCWLCLFSSSFACCFVTKVFYMVFCLFVSFVRDRRQAKSYLLLCVLRKSSGFAALLQIITHRMFIKVCFGVGLTQNNCTPNA